MNNELRILIVDTMPVRRGAQIFVRDLGRALIQRGHAVKKVYLYASGEAVVLTLEEGDEMLGGNAAHVFEKFPAVHPVLVQRMVRCIGSYQPDVILFNGSRTYKYAAAVKPLLASKPVFVFRLIDSVAAWNTTQLKRLWYRRWIYPVTDALVAVSRSALQDFQLLFPTNKPATIIHRAVDETIWASAPSREEARQAFSLSDRDKVVLFLGSLTPQKRPEKFVALVKQLHGRDSNVSGWMVGDGELRTPTEELIRSYGLEDIITLWGYKEDVRQYVAAADVLTLTSYTEGIPGVVLEAARMQVPVVSTRTGGLEECVEEGKTGFLVDQDDQEAFVQRVALLLRDEPLRLAFGRQAKQKMNAEFSWEGVVDRYEQFLVEGVQRFWDELTT